MTRGIDKRLPGAAMREALDTCLVGSATHPTFDPAAYRHLRDPLPVWEPVHG